MKIEGNHFLVTGGAGFIGSHLVDMLLEEGVEKITIFDNYIRGGEYNISQSLCDKRVSLFGVKGDLTHVDEIERATQGVDGVFHMASLCLAHCQDYPRAGMNVNVVGTFNLLEACVKNGVKRVMFASSSSIYGNAVYSPMDEKHPWGNRNFYGATKIAGESIIKAFHYKYNLEYLAFRFMNVYGPRQDYMGVYVAVIMKIIDRLNHNLPPKIFGEGTQAFDFIFVKDVCRSLILAMKSSHTNESYNISSGKQVSILEVCKMIMNLMDKKDIPIEFEEIDDMTLVNDRIGSTDKAKKDLGFEIETSLEKGLLQVIEWKLGEKKE